MHPGQYVCGGTADDLFGPVQDVYDACVGASGNDGVVSVFGYYQVLFVTERVVLLACGAKEEAVAGRGADVACYVGKQCQPGPDILLPAAKDEAFVIGECRVEPDIVEACFAQRVVWLECFFVYIYRGVSGYERYVASPPPWS